MKFVRLVSTRCCPQKLFHFWQNWEVGFRSIFRGDFRVRWSMKNDSIRAPDKLIRGSIVPCSNGFVPIAHAVPKEYQFVVSKESSPEDSDVVKFSIISSLIFFPFFLFQVFKAGLKNSPRPLFLKTGLLAS